MSTVRQTSPSAARATARLLRGGWHPVQIEALTILSERVASSQEIAVELGLTKAKASYVSYHVRKLRERGLVKLVRTVPVRGVKERFYRASAPFVVMGEAAERMTLDERLGLSIWTISCINRDFLMAIESRTIDARPDRCLCRFPLLLDERGIEELFDEHNQVFYRTKQIQVESDDRCESSGKSGESISAILASFPMPVATAAEAGLINLPQMDRHRRRPSAEAAERAVSATARMLRGGWQPLQIEALTILSERVASPKEIAAELGLPKNKVGQVSYHVKELLARGQVELVRTVPVRGANEHFYAATIPLVATTEDSERMPLAERLLLSCWTIACINRDFLRAVESKTIDERVDRHLTRLPLSLDEQAIKDVFSEHVRCYHRTLEIQADSDKRCALSGEGTRAVAAVIASFPVPSRKTIPG